MITVQVEVEEALGPGLELGVDPSGAPRITGMRTGGMWLGADRGSVVDTDTGGVPLAALIVLPSSSALGARLEAEVLGAIVDGDREVVITRLADAPVPVLPVLMTLARSGPDARWVGPEQAQRLVRDARGRFRTRRAERRVMGGRAWQATGETDPGRRRFTTAHSLPEYRLDRLPPRFIRGLEGLLDDEERIVYSIERPPAPEGSLLDRARGGRDRRAGLLLLTDRQILWLVDHVQPNRYLLDWGVDARFMPVEAVAAADAHRAHGARTVSLRVDTRTGHTLFPLPAELIEEARVMAELLCRFAVPSPAAMRRRYEPIEAALFVPHRVEHYRQEDEARRLLGEIGDALAPEPILGCFYAPRREQVRHSTGAAVTASRIAVGASGSLSDTALDSVSALSLALSPLIGRLHVETLGREQPALSMTYPFPLADAATPFIRQIRHAWANAV